MTLAGLDPAIFGSEDQRLIHWFRRPSPSVECPIYHTISPMHACLGHATYAPSH